VFSIQTDKYFAQDIMLKYYSTVSGDKNLKTESVLRPDLSVEENGTKYIKIYGTSSDDPDKCDYKNMTAAEAKDFFGTLLYFAYETVKFDDKISGEFQGKKCSLYRMVNDNVTYYVDDDNALLGISIITYHGDPSEMHNLTVVYTYKYEEIPLSEFAMTKDISSNCADEVYAPPTERLCSAPSSGVAPSSTPAPTSSATPASSGKKSSSSDASTAKAVVAMTLLSLVIALF